MKGTERIKRFNQEVSDLKSSEQLVCEHPTDKRASFKSHGKGFCWKCGEHITN